MKMITGMQLDNKNFEDMFSRFGTLPECHRQTDGQTRTRSLDCCTNVALCIMRTHYKNTSLLLCSFIFFTSFWM